MRRFWVPAEVLAKDPVVIEGDLFHHVCEVSRFGPGDRVEFLCGDQKAYLVQLETVRKPRAWGHIISQREIAPLAGPEIHLALSLPRYSTFEMILEKAVELGAYQIHPFVSDFSFVRKLGKVPKVKLSRWQKIVAGASQQSGRGELMKLAEITTMENILEEFNRQTNVEGLFLYEGKAQKSLKDALRLADSSSAKQIWIFIGSEGGFSEREVEIFKQKELDPVTLGSQILRVETACLALLSIIKYECDALA